MSPPPVRIGTRGSQLALVQARTIQAALQAAHPDRGFTLEILTTTGDQVRDVPLQAIGGVGAFTKELEQALLDTRVDLAVHSMKDLPTAVGAELCVGAVVGREDVRDALVSRNGETLAALPERATVGTSSVRRRAQALAARPDLRIMDIRGNVDTRLRKVADGEYDATLLACAGLHRLGREDAVSEALPLRIMLPAPAQGALAIECRDTGEWRDLLKPVHNTTVAACVRAERAFLDACGGGCSVPVGAYAENQSGSLTVHGVIAALDGTQVFRRTSVGPPADAEALGRDLAERTLAEGAAEIIDDLLRSRAP